LISQLSFISLFSIEMLSDCVISGLYMRVHKLTWKNLIFVNFPQFFDVSVWSIWTDMWSGQYSLGVQTGPACVRTRAASTGRTVSKTVRTSVTCLLVPNAARVRTTLIHRLDRDPTEAIYTPDCHILSHTPHNLLFGIL
jgi:hypothetical protein